MNCIEIITERVAETTWSITCIKQLGKEKYPILVYLTEGSISILDSFLTIEDVFLVNTKDLKTTFCREISFTPMVEKK